MVGVPLIVPVDESIDKPVGSGGAIDQVTTGPPCAVAVKSSILESFANDRELEV
jgi:hypothetical protein